jgi:hypothetical protein
MGRELSIGERYRLKDEAGVDHEADWLMSGRAGIAMALDFAADAPLGFTTRVDFAGAMDDHGAYRLNGPSAVWASMALHRRTLHSSRPGDARDRRVSRRLVLPRLWRVRPARADVGGCKRKQYISGAAVARLQPHAGAPAWVVGEWGGSRS